MPNIQIFDPALCCSTGVCGVEVDQNLVNFAADVDWAKQNGAQVERFNLAQQPLAFAENLTVKGFLERSGQEALPLVLVDGEVALAGRYPNRSELTRWAGIKAPDASQPKTLAALAVAAAERGDSMHFLTQPPRFLSSPAKGRRQDLHRLRNGRATGGPRQARVARQHRPGFQRGAGFRREHRQPHHGDSRRTELVGTGNRPAGGSASLP